MIDSKLLYVFNQTRPTCCTLYRPVPEPVYLFELSPKQSINFPSNNCLSLSTYPGLQCHLFDWQSDQIKLQLIEYQKVKCTQFPAKQFLPPAASCQLPGAFRPSESWTLSRPGIRHAGHDSLSGNPLQTKYKVICGGGEAREGTGQGRKQANPSHIKVFISPKECRVLHSTGFVGMSKRVLEIF